MSSDNDDARRAHDLNARFLESANEATVKSADAALRAALLINGGAAVSVLAFMGGIVSQGRIQFEQLVEVSGSLTLFAFGIATAAVGLVFSYFTNSAIAGHAASQEPSWQHPYVKDGPRTSHWARLKTGLLIVTILVGLSSILLFICGTNDVRNSIVKLKSSQTAASTSPIKATAADQ